MDYDKGIAHKQAGRLEAALGCFNDAILAGDTRAISKACVVLYLLGRYVDTVNFCQKHIQDKHCKLVLGVCYYSGNGIEKDYAKSERLLKGAAHEGEDTAKSNLAILFNAMEQYGVEDEYFWCQEAAIDGVERAKKRLLEMVRQGRGIPPDRYAEHIEYLTGAASTNSEAQFQLGAHYHYGEFGLPVDHATAVIWYLKAVNGGNHEAMNNLGTIYEYSDQVTRDYKKAEQYYNQAISVDAQFVPAVVNLANLYISGKGGLKNLDEANRLLQTVSSHADAQASMSRLYASGEGAYNDLEKSKDLQKQAADAGSFAALRDLAVVYEGDEGQSYRWLSMGAEAGDPLSQVKLGKLCSETGDYASALHWLNSASQKGNLEGKELLISVGEQAEMALFG